MEVNPFDVISTHINGKGTLWAFSLYSLGKSEPEKASKGKRRLKEGL